MIELVSVDNQCNFVFLTTRYEGEECLVMLFQRIKYFSV